MPLISREDFNDAVDSVLKGFAGVTKLNEHQSDALFHLIQRQDVFAMLPTGFGKSLVFQLLPALCRELHNMGYVNYPTSAIVLVICPLVALIESQMNELEMRGISCASLFCKRPKQESSFDSVTSLSSSLDKRSASRRCSDFSLKILK